MLRAKINTIFYNYNLYKHFLLYELEKNFRCLQLVTARPLVPQINIGIRGLEKRYVLSAKPFT